MLLIGLAIIIAFVVGYSFCYTWIKLETGMASHDNIAHYLPAMRRAVLAEKANEEHLMEQTGKHPKK